MRRGIIMLVAAAAMCVPAAAVPASASHRCGLEGVSHTVNVICDNYHSPKNEVSYLVCIAKGQCPLS